MRSQRENAAWRCVRPLGTAKLGRDAGPFPDETLGYSIQAPPIPPEIIQYAVWIYYRFNLSHRDIEDLLARRGVLVTHESIRLWCNSSEPFTRIDFGAGTASTLPSRVSSTWVAT
jgi:hypothetical protein